VLAFSVALAPPPRGTGGEGVPSRGAWHPIQADLRRLPQSLRELAPPQASAGTPIGLRRGPGISALPPTCLGAAMSETRGRTPAGPSSSPPGSAARSRKRDRPATP